MPGPTVVIGTAGHIDHGKTTLLRALTGIDADRLPEERTRGMTIDVGYAHFTFDDGVELDFVDVPGHDRLIGNMLVGAGEIDAALLVVAADDGPRPQTIEHLQLLDALGIGDGLAVVTKADAVPPDRVAEVGAAVRGLLAGTSLAAAPILAASAISGDGLDELRIALRVLRDRVAGRGLQPGPLRLAVDRAFSVQGRGAVVTGSLRGGSVGRGMDLRREPGGEPLRVRDVQVHGAARASSDGGRTALNVSGLPFEALRRGDVLTAGDGIGASDRLLVRTQRRAGPAARGAWPPGPRTQLRLHLGTDQVEAFVRRLPGVDDAVLVSLARPVATFRGDRGVLRRPSPGEVVAGVVVLDFRPPRGVSRRRIELARLQTLGNAVEAGAAAVADAATLDLHGFHGGAFAPDVRDTLESAALELVAAHHRETPLSAGLSLPRARTALLRRVRSLATVERRDAAAAAIAVTELIDDLVATGRLVRRGDALRDPAHGEDLPPELVTAMARLESALSTAAPPSLAEAAAAAGCPPEGVRALQSEGRIIRIGADLAWSATTYQGLAALALEHARIAPLTPAAFRDATGTSRKYVLPILEDLDRRGILHRTAEGHIPGPRAPRASAPA